MDKYCIYGKKLFLFGLMTAAFVAVFAMFTVQASAQVYSGEPVDSVIQPSGDVTGVTDRKAIQKALNLGGNVTLSPGEYYLDYSVYIKYDGITLNAAGATVTQVQPGTGLLRTTPNGTGGYDLLKNVTVKGGTWIGNTETPSDRYGYSSFFFKHSSGITISGCTILNNYKGHLIEFAAVSDSVVENCTIGGTSVSTGGKEAIQLDTTYSSSTAPGGSPYDKTPCRNIKIVNNSITYSGVGIGSHSAVYGNYHDGIAITGNTFYTTGAGISVISVYNMTVSGNRFLNASTAIRFKSTGVIVGDSKSEYSSAVNLSVTGNVIDKATQNGIYIGGSSKRTIKGVTVSGNRVNASGQSAILTDWCSESTVSKNKLYQISGKQNNGVYLRNSSNANTVSGNTIKTATGNGIWIAKSYGNTVSKNKVSAVQRNGVYLEKCGKNTVVKSNTVSGTGRSGVAVERTDNVQITGNKITNAGKKKYGIYVMGSVKPSIKNNKIVGTCLKPIFLTASVKKANIGTMDKTTLTGGAKAGRDLRTGRCDNGVTSVTFQANGKNYKTRLTTKRTKQSDETTVTTKRYTTRSKIKLKKGKSVTVVVKDKGANKYYKSYTVK